ncbi:cell filamentation protein Fic [Bifidobacterium callitrichos]|uniref:protein adenylyltransferase n=1 Tax=Bifidobacterium callitrichos TaxID=762209 RepID=A0A5M9ZDV9_9BIFI|nr:Fic family protein [Bifidobacterium callitrichos]KAA8817153.1 cell filamentation protein Fic [Bifidobacterium callitrichos]
MVSIVAFELQRLLWNSYFDPETGLLKNLVNARTQDELDQAEASAVTIMETVLESDPPENTGDLTQLQEIHRQLFSRIYPWAGSIRTVNLRKEADSTHAFADASRIEYEMRLESKTLHEQDNMLKGLEIDEFVERLTIHFAVVNRIHPFREGNGRTQRLFWTLIAREAGHPLDWRHIDGTWMIRASRKSMDDDLTDLRDLIARVVADGGDANDSVDSVLRIPALHLPPSA